MTPRWLLLLPSLVLTSCGLFDREEADCATVLCAPCEPALTVRLHVPEGQTAPQAALEGASGGCDLQQGLTVCTLSESRSGTFEFDIQATGYKKAHVVETVSAREASGCCSCGFESRRVDVQLTPQ